MVTRQIIDYIFQKYPGQEFASFDIFNEFVNQKTKEYRALQTPMELEENEIVFGEMEIDEKSSDSDFDSNSETNSADLICQNITLDKSDKKRKYQIANYIGRPIHYLDNNNIHTDKKIRCN